MRTLFLVPAAALGAGVMPVAAQTTDNAFNPAISLILDGRYAQFSNDPEDYELPGFPLGGEAGIAEKGFQIGHNELAISANVDDLFYGSLTAALADHEGATEVELEEAFIETIGLGSGLTMKAGRFYSGLGYLNEHHAHAWDFVDAPLVYRGLFGNQLRDDGLQLRWLAPTDLFLRVGAEVGRGATFPAAGAANEGRGTWTAFVETGGDVGTSHSWQLGLSRWTADVEGRTAGGHGHAHEEETTEAHEPVAFTGDSRVTGVDFVWKWAPRGNPTQRNLKLQAEYFVRDEDGELASEHDGAAESASYDGSQSGWYAQAAYQFMPQWRVGLRYDRLKADNSAGDDHLLAEAGLDDEGHTPTRSSIMVDYSRTEFSRLRLQLNRDDSSEDSDTQVFLQYVVSLGAHGAHRF